MDAHAQAGNGRITGRDAGDPPAASDARHREGGRDHPDWEEEERALALLTNSPDPREQWAARVDTFIVLLRLI